MPKKIIIPIVVISLYIISLFVPLISPYSQFPLYFVKCGGKPPIIASRFAAAWSYSMPGDVSYQVTPFAEYFCTEEEAQKAHFSRASW